MEYAKGTKIWLIHLRETGTVVRQLEDDMVLVQLAGGEEIPVDKAAVEVASKKELKQAEPPSRKDIAVASSKKKSTAPPSKIPHSNSGLLLAFEVLTGLDGTPEKYKVHLLNDTLYDVLYNFEISFSESKSIRDEGILKSLGSISPGRMLYDQLNEAPIVNVSINQITTAGTAAAVSKQVKIKAKQFFRKITTAPLLNKAAHLYLLFNAFDGNVKSENTEDLKSYTDRVVQPSKHRYHTTSKNLNAHESRELAAFKLEVDLHIENLTDDFKKMSNSEILRLQIRVFKDYLDKAIRLGVPRVFIIHGLGKGRLRDAIATYLLKMPEVKSFNNDYHPRYGHGATEVEL